MSQAPLIQLAGLTKTYQMGDAPVRALAGADLVVRHGEFLAITGASGSGKSTMMHLLGCLDRPTAGSYHLDGLDVSRMPDGELARIRNQRIGFVFQTFNLIPRTSAVENVAVPLFYARKRETRGPALRALERVGLTHRATHRPSELSGGERQRVAIARAIVNDPPLLLADEPTGNLDTRTGEQIMQLFHDLNAQGVTIIIVTHEYDVAIQTRRIVQMRDGRIISDRPTAEIVAAGNFHLRPREAGGGATADDTVNVASAEPAAAPAAPAGGGGRLLLLAGAGLALLATGWGVAQFVKLPTDRPPDRLPPLDVLWKALASFALMGAGWLLGVTALLLARRAGQRARAAAQLVPRAARLAGWLGLLTTVAPLALITFNLLRRLWN